MRKENRIGHGKTSAVLFFILLLPRSDSPASSQCLLFLTCNKAYLFRAAGILNSFCTVRCDGLPSVIFVTSVGNEGLSF